MNKKQIKSAKALSQFILDDDSERDSIYDCIDSNFDVTNTLLYHAMVIYDIEFEFWVMVNLYIRDNDFTTMKTREDYDVR